MVQYFKCDINDKKGHIISTLPMTFYIKKMICVRDSYLLHHIDGSWNIVHWATNISRASIALVLGDEVSSDERWNQPLLICVENSWPIALVILHHLNLKDQESNIISFLIQFKITVHRKQTVWWCFSYKTFQLSWISCPSSSSSSPLLSYSHFYTLLYQEP